MKKTVLTFGLIGGAIMAAMMFFMFRSQSKRQKELNAMIASTRSAHSSSRPNSEESRGSSALRVNSVDDASGD